MKKSLLYSTILSLAIAISPAFGSEADHFREAVEHAIKPIVSEDIAAALKETEALVKQGAKIVAEEAHELHDDKERKLAELTAANAEKMLSMSSEELEEGWIHGEALASEGVDLAEYDHFSKVMSYYDMVIHPAMAHSLLKEYQESRKRHLLVQAREELSELLEHEDDDGGHGGSDNH